MGHRGVEEACGAGLPDYPADRREESLVDGGWYGRCV